jgi:hypothetical protein
VKAWQCQLCPEGKGTVKMGPNEHDLLAHKQKTSCYICNCGYSDIVRENFENHLTSRHSTVVKGNRLELMFWVWGVPPFRRMYTCKSCPLRTPYDEVRVLHDCDTFLQKTTELPPRHEWQKWLRSSKVPYVTIPISVRHSIVTWLRQEKKEVKPGFWNQDCEVEILRVQALHSAKSDSEKSEVDVTDPHCVDKEQQKLEAGAQEGRKPQARPQSPPRVRQVERDPKSRSYYEPRARARQKRLREEVAKKRADEKAQERIRAKERSSSLPAQADRRQEASATPTPFKDALVKRDQAMEVDRPRPRPPPGLSGLPALARQLEGKSTESREEVTSPPNKRPKLSVVREFVRT